jgi:nicotinamidase-related amidase
VSLSSAPTFDRAHAAVLAMDVQAGIVSIYAKPRQEYLDRSSAVLRAARNAGLTVIFVRMGFRPGLPEVSDSNKLFAAIKANPEHQKLFTDDRISAIHPELGPEQNDIVVAKHRVSAFAGTDLEMILRAKEIRTLVLFGIATSGVVLSTLLEASDADFEIVIIGDCCADTDDELHRVLLERLFPRRATVITAAEFQNAL